MEYQVEKWNACVHTIMHAYASGIAGCSVIRSHSLHKQVVMSLQRCKVF